MESGLVSYITGSDFLYFRSEMTVSEPALKWACWINKTYAPKWAKVGMKDFFPLLGKTMNELSKIREG